MASLQVLKAEAEGERVISRVHTIRGTESQRSNECCCLAIRCCSMKLAHCAGIRNDKSVSKPMMSWRKCAACS